MNGIPPGLMFERFVPANLMQGYLSGEYTLWGSVLRRTKGTGGAGEYVGFLTEGRKLTEQVQAGVPLDSSHLMSSIGNMQMAAQLASGIGILNLGVSVAGFAMIARRLDRIADSIATLQDGLRQVSVNVAWLRADTMHGLRADAATALELADRGARQKSSMLFNQSKTLAGRTRRHLGGHLRDMAMSGSLLREDQLYREFLSMSALLAVAEARSTEAVEGAGRAALELRDTAAELRRSSDAFGTPLRSFPASARMLLEVAGRRAEVKASGAAMEALVSRVEAYVPQLELQDALGLDAVGWRALTAPEGSEGILCITAHGLAGRDLLAAVRDPRTAW